jgi:hypothetical protein
MAGPVVVARVVKIHLNTTEADWHTSVTGLTENDGLNRAFKAVGDLADLASAIAFILSILAPIMDGPVVRANGPTGDLHALATNILATYPSGYIPSVPTS